METDDWVQLSTELDAAFEIANFTKAERIILRELKKPIYGMLKEQSVRLCLTEIASRGKWIRQVPAKGLRTLLASNVVRVAKDGGYEINKYYETWTTPSGTRSRFTKGEDEYIKGCVTPAKKRTPKIAKPESRIAQHINKIGELSSSKTELSSSKTELSSSKTELSGSVPIYKERVPGDLQMETEEEGDAPFPQSEPLKPREKRDQAEYDLAVSLLMEDMDCQGIGMHLTANPSRELRELEGWRFLVAAKKFTSADFERHLKKREKYFMSIVRTADRAELDKKPSQPKRPVFRDVPLPEEYIPDPTLPPKIYTPPAIRRRA